MLGIPNLKISSPNKRCITKYVERGRYVCMYVCMYTRAAGWRPASLHFNLPSTTLGVPILDYSREEQVYLA